jgi:hypothetical protein
MTQPADATPTPQTPQAADVSPTPATPTPPTPTPEAKPPAPPQEPRPPEPAKRPRRRPKILAAVVVVLLIAVPVFLKFGLPPIVASVLKSQLSAGGKAKVEVGSVRFDFPLTLGLTGLKVWAPGADDKPPVIHIVSAEASLGGIPLGGPVDVSHVHVVPEILTTDLPDGGDTLSRWATAFLDSLGPSDPNAKKTPLDELVRLGRIEIRDGVVGYVPAGGDASQAVGLRGLTADVLGQDPPRTCLVSVDGRIEPVGALVVRGQFDLRDLVLTLFPKTEVTVELDDKKIAAMPAKLRNLLAPMQPRGRVVIAKTDVELHLNAPLDSRAKAVVTLTDGHLRVPGTDLVLSGAAGEIDADTAEAIKVLVSARANGEPVTLTANAQPLGDGSFSVRAAHSDAARLQVAGKMPLSATGPLVLTVSELTGRADFGKPLFAALLRRPDGTPIATGVAGTAEVTGRAVVDLSATAVRDAVVDWRFAGLAADFGPTVGKLSEGSAAGSVRPGEAKLDHLHARFGSAVADVPTARAAFDPKFDFAKPVTLSDLRAFVRAAGAPDSLPPAVELTASAVYDGRTVSAKLQQCTAHLASVAAALTDVPAAGAVAAMKPIGSLTAAASAEWNIAAGKPDRWQAAAELTGLRAEPVPGDVRVADGAVTVKASGEAAGGTAEVTGLRLALALWQPGADKPELIPVGDVSAKVRLGSDFVPGAINARIGESPVGPITVGGTPAELTAKLTAEINDKLLAALPPTVRTQLAEQKLAGAVPVEATVRMPPGKPMSFEVRVADGRLESAAYGTKLTGLTLTAAADADFSKVRVSEFRLRPNEGDISGSAVVSLGNNPSAEGRLTIAGATLPLRSAAAPWLRGVAADGSLSFSVPLDGRQLGGGDGATLKGLRVAVEHVPEGAAADAPVRRFEIADINATLRPNPEQRHLLLLEGRVGKVLGGSVDFDGLADPKTGDAVVRIARGEVRLAEADAPDIPAVGALLQEKFRPAGTATFSGWAAYASKPAEGRPALTWNAELRLTDASSGLGNPAARATNVNATVTTDQTRVTLHGLTADVYGGRVQAAVRVRLPGSAGGAPAFEGDADVLGVRLGQVVDASAKPGSPPTEVRGLLTARVEFAGDTTGLGSLAAKGRARVREGHFAGIPVFDAIGEALKKALAITPFRGALDQQADAGFAMKDRVLTLGEVTVSDPLVMMQIRDGKVRFPAAPEGSAAAPEPEFDLTVEASPLGKNVKPLAGLLDKLGGTNIADIGNFVLPLKVTGPYSLPLVVPGVPFRKKDGKSPDGDKPKPLIPPIKLPGLVPPPKK